MNFLWYRLAKVMAQYSSHEAIVCGDRRVTYAELNHLIQEASAHLELESLPRSSVVAINLPNGIEFVAAFWAVIRSGHVALTLNTKYLDGELQQYLTHRAVAMLITEAAHRDKLVECFARESLETKVVTMSGDVNKSAPAMVPLSAFAGWSAPALMQFSTGSTGRPKGVIRTHGNLLEEIDGARERLGTKPTDRVAAIVPLYHAHGLGNAMCAALFAGATLVLAPGFDPRTSLELLSREKVTIFPAVPFMIKMLAMTRTSETTDLSALRLCYTAGAALPAEDAERFKAKFGVSVHQLYGSTETGAAALSYESSEGSLTAPCVGRPFNHVKIHLFDEDESFNTPGKEGEIGISTEAATDGYDANETATRASFRRGFFFPGDLGTFDEAGRLTITGRKSLFINAGGNKVDPAEVEQVIMELPDVQEAVALGVPSANGGETIKAVVVAGSELSRDVILEHCRNRLATFKLPKVVEFRLEIPKSPLGKVLRKYLL